MASAISEIDHKKEGDIKLLLRLIYHNAKLNPLLERGYTYSQVVNLLTLAENKKLIKVSDGEIQLTNDGFLYVKKTSTTDRYDAGWIRPLNEEKVEPMGDNELYLPPRSTVRALRRQGH